MQKIALITGANRGLGLETARLLGRQDMRVLLGARDAAAGDRAARELRSEGIDAERLLLDVAGEASVRSAAADTVRRHGRLDVLVNNAGVLPEATGLGADATVDLEAFRVTFATNVFGAVTVCQHFLPLLRQAPAGVIVNVSSRMGSLADQVDPESPYFGVVVPAYQSSKAALNGLTVALAKRLADTHITVTSVCPGWLQTDLGGPENRAAAPMTAADGAETVVQAVLSSDRAGAGAAAFVDRDGVVAW